MLQVCSQNSVPAVEDCGTETEVDTLHRSCGVYTETKVVNRILDAVGWKADADLSRARLLEPAAGNGQFVVEAARRLVASHRSRGAVVSAASLRGRILAFELHSGAAEEARSRTDVLLREIGVHHRTAAACTKAWIKNADFLLTPKFGEEFTHAVGNPPYIRWAKIPEKLKARYTARLSREMTGGDLFLPFLDLALEQLRPGGRCGFLCSDRWRFMAFAGPFRRKWLPALNIESEDQVAAGEVFIDDVDAYPSILVASKRRKRIRRNSPKRRMGKKTLRELGYVVKVGPALGHTPAFVLEENEDDVEPALLKPWIDGSEITEGAINWHGRRVVTLFTEEGKLVNLQDFHLLATRLNRFAIKLRQRSIVRNGAPWYRTIDRIRAKDWERPKLLLPELANPPRLVIDRTGKIPSHGVYAIFAPNDEVGVLYEHLRDGRLAEALEDISPKIKGGYTRCYKRFLMKIQVDVTYDMTSQN